MRVWINNFILLSNMICQLQGFYLTEGEAAEVTVLPTTTAAAPRSKWTGWYNSYNPYSTEDTEGDFEERLALDPVR